VSELLKPGMMIGNNELLERLSLPTKLISAWKARGSDGKEYVLRFLSSYGMANVPKKDLEPIKALPPIHGFVPWLDWDMVHLDAKVIALVIRRPYYPQSLAERFPPDAAHPPSKALLDMFHQLAQTFETLQTYLPNFDFDLSPGNLLLNGDVPLLVDCGLTVHALNMDMDNRMPISHYVEHERGVPMSASYPSQWRLWASTKSAYKDKVHRTDPQYALGALYIYLRTRFLVFEDPADPDQWTGNLSRREILLTMFGWYMKLSTVVQAYEEKGTLNLPMLVDEQERSLVARALARDETARYPSCTAFVEALQTL
jgi:hypothetical protein